MKRREAELLAKLLRTAGGKEANGLADRLLNAGSNRVRGDISELAADLLSPPPKNPKTGLLVGEIPFDQRFVDRYAVTMSESGGAVYVEAASHLEALWKVNPLLGYAGREWPEHDDAMVFLNKHGGRFVEAHDGAKEFIREYGSITSPDVPVWNEKVGTLMVLVSPELDQEVWVYPVVAVDLPAEGEPLPGWEGGVTDKYSPNYGTWRKQVKGFYLLVHIETPEDRTKIPAGGFTYRWTAMEYNGYRMGKDIAKGTGQPSAAAAQQMAEDAIRPAKKQPLVFAYGDHGVDIKIRDRNEPGVFWANGNSFVLVESDLGPWMIGSRRVALLSINGLGEIRWDVQTGWPGKDGEQAIKHFGLTKVEVSA